MMAERFYPKVTVSIACYNVAKFIPKNIDCVLEQTYRNLEIILVNDGSTDESGALCNAIADEDARVRVIHKPNGGLGSARNASLDAATGEYLYFCDIDDRIEFTLIEDLVRIAEKELPQMIIFGIDFYNQSYGIHDPIRFPDKVFSSNAQLKKQFCQDVFFKKHGNGFVCNKFYQRSFIEENRFRFGCERIQQDEPFNLRLYLKIDRLVLTSMSGYHYYYDANESTGAKYVDRKFEAVRSVFESLRSFYDQWELNETLFLYSAYKRFRGAILNVICYNYFLETCPLTFKQKRDRIHQIALDNCFLDCYSYLEQEQDLDCVSRLIWTLLKHRQVNLLICTNSLLVKMRKVFGK